MSRQSRKDVQGRCEYMVGYRILATIQFLCMGKLVELTLPAIKKIERRADDRVQP
jgi:hypothetical protein